MGHLMTREKRSAVSTAPGWKEQGIGTGLIQFLMGDLQEYDLMRLIWCNARMKSSAFYREFGWQEVSEVFVRECRAIGTDVQKGIAAEPPKVTILPSERRLSQK